MSQYSFEAMVMYGFKEIDAFFSEFFEAFMSEYKLNAIQIKAIMEVKISKAISMKDLCDRLGMSKSNLSPVCKKLEGLKLLKKTRDFHDQRIVNLEITPAGEEVLSALCSQIKERQYNGKDTAVKIGQSFLKVRFQTAAHVARYLTHSIQQSLPGVFTGNIQPESLREVVHTGLGSLQCRQSRQLQNGRHTNGQNRKERDPAQIQEKPLKALPPADLIHKKEQKNKNTDKESDIVVGINGQEQG